ncbi:MAG: hypothetical protein VX943_04405, partial [SAR324 cluster bacterium]|nr:hypothetical protein [SAR324 cluster bacterium]
GDERRVQKCSDLHLSEKMRVRIPAGMFLVSSAALMYEISLSRLLAIELWNHYAFLIISGALLGYGAAGAFRLSSSRRIPPLLPVLCFSLLLIPPLISGFLFAEAIMRALEFSPLAAQSIFKTFAPLILLVLSSTKASFASSNANS